MSKEINEQPLNALGNIRNQWLVNDTICDISRGASQEKTQSIQAAPQSLLIDKSRTALIVIDMQNDFCHSQGWLASIGVDISPARKPIEPLNRLLPKLRASSVPIIWLNWGNRPDKLNLSPSLLHVYNSNGISTGLGDALEHSPGTTPSRVLEKNAWSAAVVDELNQRDEDIHIDKFRMSGFFDTCLDSVLRNLDIKTLLFAGVNADQCVLATLMDANFLGYDCVFLEDCCATTSPNFCWDSTLYNIKQCFGFITASEQF
jgi:nicotinamidase-related amidase